MGEDSDEDEMLFILRPKEEKVLFNPIKVARAIQQSPFAKYDDVNINKRKKIITIKAKDTMSALSKLNKTVKIGDVDVECFVKGEADSERYGVIHLTPHQFGHN